MTKLLMISGDRSLAQGKKGAFYNTLEEFHKYWDRIDIICPKALGPNSKGVTRLGVPHEAQIAIELHGGEEGQDPVFGNKVKFFDNVFIHPSPWPLIFQPFWILKKGLKIYKEQKFDLMTVHEYPPFYNGIGARLLWNKIKIPYVLEIFHIPGYPKAANLKEKIYRQFFYYFIRYDSKKAKAVRVMNSQVAEKLVALGVPESKIKLIPAIYIDLDIFKPMDLEKKYDLIFVGRLAKNKGIDLFLEAVKRLNCKAAIIGDGPLKEKIKLKIENWKLKINMYGWVKDSQEIARLLNQSKILVMPSYNEGGPRVIVEAMACGILILATPVGIVADILKDGQFGQIIKWDANDITEKAKYLLVNELEYQKYSEAPTPMHRCGGDVALFERFEKKSAIKNYAEKLQKLI